LNKTSKIDIPHLDEKVYKHTTEEGLEIHIMEKKGFSKKYAFFGTRYGSIDNSFVADGKYHDMPHGIAHFLEHKVFEEEKGDVFEIFSKSGAKSNAYTSHDSTNYLFSCTDRFYKNLETLIDFVQKLNIDKNSVDKEKGIIKQEIMMYEDNPEWRAYINTLKLMYPEHPVHIDIAGTVESIKEIDKERLETCYRTFYSPNNMIVFLIGDIDRFKAIDVIKKTITQDFKKRNSKIERIVHEDLGPVDKEIHRESLSIASPIFYMGIKCHQDFEAESDILKKEIFVDIFLNSMLGKGSNLYNDLYEKGMIGKNFGYDYNYGSAYGYILIGGESEKPEETYDILKAKFVEFLGKDPKKEDFDRIKKKLKGESLIYLNSLDYIANAYVSAHHKGIDFFNYFKELEKFDYETYASMQKNYRIEGKTVLSVVYPNSGEVS